MTSIDTKERARDARHAIEQAAAANGVYVAAPLDSEIDRILIAAFEAQAAELEARIRHMVLVAWNRTLNTSGGVGYGVRNADAMKALLLAAYAAEPPAWAKTDEVIALPAPTVRQ